MKTKSITKSESRETLLNKLGARQIKRSINLRRSIIFMFIDFFFFFSYETIDAFNLEFFSRTIHLIIYSIKVNYS